MGEGIAGATQGGAVERRAIACRGCGATGEAAWDMRAMSGDIRPTGLPLSVSGGFFFHESSCGMRVACERCQQIIAPG